MNMNELTPAKGANKNRMRVGRGLAKKGKTCGAGQKGQLSRGSGKVRIGFESGHVSLLNRIPKFGFTSRKSLISVDLPMFVLNAIDPLKYPVITMDVLKELDFIRHGALRVKLYKKGELMNKAYHLKGIQVTQGVRECVEKEKGSIDG